MLNRVQPRNADAHRFHLPLPARPVNPLCEIISSPFRSVHGLGYDAAVEYLSARDANGFGRLDLHAHRRLVG